MSDRLTQLQDAVDEVRTAPTSLASACRRTPPAGAIRTDNLWRQLAQQFVASVHYVNLHHNLETLGPNDQIRELNKEPEQSEG